jgi:tripartite-type tricarboxylate transporter receptor subunit TctC
MRFAARTLAMALPGLLAALMALAGAALAQAPYPARPVDILVPAEAGGGMDILGRLVASKLTASLGQPVLVQNKPGAAGMIASETVARAPADGYTVMEGAIGTVVLNAYLYKNIRYDSLKDFVPVSKAVTVSNVLVVNPALPARTIQEFVALARARPGELNNALSGFGAAGHLAGELFSEKTGVRFTNVAYKGGNAAVADVVKGDAQFSFATVASVLQLVKAGRLRALAVTTAERVPSLPEVPTVAETVAPGFEASNWYCYLAPAKTPPAVVERLNRDIREALSSPDVQRQLREQGMEPTPSTPAELDGYIRSEMAKWSKIVADRNIKAD